MPTLLSKRRSSDNYDMSSAQAASFDPVAERLLNERRERQHAALQGRERLVRWFYAVGFLGVTVPLAAFAPTARHPATWVLLALVASFAVGSRVEFEVGSGTTFPAELVFIPMLFLLPAGAVPICVMAGFLVGQLPDLIRGRLPLSRLPVLVGNSWYAVGPAAVMLALGEPVAAFAAAGAMVTVLLAQFATDFAASVSREWFALRVRPRDLVRPLLWVFLIDALLAPVAFAASIAAGTNAAAALLPLSLLGLIWFFARERKGRLDQALELSTAYRGTAYLLGDVVEADDEYTGTHSREVVDLVLGVCDALRVDERTRRKAEFAALLHDVGKIKIPAEIINKPGALTPEEREIINTHTVEGEHLLLRVGGLLGEVGTIVRSCHEDFDGSGYPDGLAGEEIPLVARIVACCDAFNAMTTTRSYREARSCDEALAELQRCRGSQFDPQVVDGLHHVVQEMQSKMHGRQSPRSGATSLV